MRRREFVTGRTPAPGRRWRGLGHPAVAVPRGPRGDPVWPEGVVGSITHCAGYRAAAVARAEDVLSLGIDAEPDEALPDPGMLELIALAEERARLGELAAVLPGTGWDRLLFSAKESVYKAWFPLTGRWLGFESALVSIDQDQGAFTARLLVPRPARGRGAADPAARTVAGRSGAAGDRGRGSRVTVGRLSRVGREDLP